MATKLYPLACPSHGVMVPAVKVTEEGERSLVPMAVEPLQDGKPLMGRTVLKRESDGHFETVDLAPRATASGPAQVATPAYRANYDAIFGRKPTVGEA